jgi:GTP cyclohydrolase III
MTVIFIAADGDDIGRHLEYLIATDQMEELEFFSNLFSSSMNWLHMAIVTDLNARVIFWGGDNLLARFEFNHPHLETIESIRIKFQELSGKTLSVGLGYTPSMSLLALKLAKSKGKDRTELLKGVM